MSVATPSPPETAENHQRGGWLELFYDLVFVVVIQRLTHLLHDNPSVGRMWLTIGLTVLVWLAWFNVSAYINMSGGIGACGRPFVFASMAGMGVLSLGLEEMPEGHVRLFVTGTSSRDCRSGRCGGHRAPRVRRFAPACGIAGVPVRRGAHRARRRQFPDAPRVRRQPGGW